MATDVDIINKALSHLAIGKTIASIEESSAEAVTARLFYGAALDVTLRQFPWPFSMRMAALGLVEAQPNTEWGFSYRYPSDCLMIRRIVSGFRNDTRQSRVPYRLGSDEQGTLIYTDMENAEIEYTAKMDNPAMYPADFELALSYYLAHMMAPRLTGGDQFRLGDRAAQLYSLELSRAAAKAANEEQQEEEPESEFIRVRESDD